MEQSAARVRPEYAIGVYAEPLASGARVALFGDASLDLAGLLLELGAQSVAVFDPDESRSAGQADRTVPGVTVSSFPSDPRDLRAVDLAIVPDLGLFDDAEGLLRVVRRIVGDEGVALVGAADREVAGDASLRSFDYYELFDLVATEFQAVRMVARLPFRGVALVELGDQEDSPAVSVDTQLAEGTRRPEAFVALASQQDVRLEPYAIVELPPESRAAVGSERELLRTALAEAQLRGEVAERKLGELQVRHASAERALAETAELEAAFVDRGRQLADLSTEVEEMRAAAEAGRIAAAEVEDLALRTERAERRSASLEAEAARSSDAQAREHEQLEEALRERARTIRDLEAEVVRRDRMVRDLVGALDEAGHHPSAQAVEAPSPPPAPGPDPALGEENSRLRERLDALALDLARREGEAQASRWAIAELERKLAQWPSSPPPPSPAPDVVQRLGAALDEVDALRQALAQEHQARMQGESYQELARARTEIERQAALLERMARELEARDAAGERGRAGEIER